MLAKNQKLEDLPENHQAIMMLFDNGASAKSIAKSLKLSLTQVYRVIEKGKKYDLADLPMQKKAMRTFSKCMDGKPWGQIKTVKASDAIAAAKEVSDRSQPKINRTQNLNLNVNLSPVDLSKYAG